MIEDIVREIEVGGIYYGAVTRLTSYGAFVDLGNGREGLLHISKIAKEHIRRIEDYVQVGEKITVKVIDIDNQGRINLAMNELREKRQEIKDEENKEIFFESTIDENEDHNHDE